MLKLASPGGCHTWEDDKDDKVLILTHLQFDRSWHGAPARRVDTNTGETPGENAIDRLEDKFAGAGAWRDQMVD